LSIHDYEKPSLTTDMVLFKVDREQVQDKRKTAKAELKIVLVKREDAPQKGFLSLPGGFVGIDEGIEENVKRKLEQKAGLKGNFYMEQLYTKGDLNRDSRGRVISVSYLGLCNEENLINVGTLADVGWYKVTEILSGVYGDLAFDHAEIIEYALDRVRNKIEYTDIAFNLVPNEFTISEIQDVYELFLNKEILNFRRKISEYIVSTGKKTEGQQFRPAELYMLNKHRDSKF